MECAREGEEWNPNLSGDLKITGEFTGLPSSVCVVCCAVLCICKMAVSVYKTTSLKAK